MGAADAGATVLLCDKAPKGEAGGNSRVCGGIFACTEGDVDAAVAYYTALAADRPVPEDILASYTEGIAGMRDTMVAKFGFPEDELAISEGMTSPEYPEFSGADKLNGWKWSDPEGRSIYQYMRQRLEEQYADRIDVWFETPSTALIQDPQSKAIVGVAVDRTGEPRNVRALNGVCICAGGFENNAEMVQTYLGVGDIAVRGGLFNTGDGIRMCQDAGCKLWHMNVYEGNKSPMNACGYYTEPGVNGICFTFPLDGSLVAVGTLGKRFGDEHDWTRHGHVDEGNGIWEMVHYPERMWLVWDQAQMDDIDASGRFDEAYRDTVTACATLADVAAATGCDEAVLQETIDDFNFYVEVGKDYEWGRDAASMRAFDGAAYYCMPVKPVMLNTQGGPQRNGKAEILDLEGNPIPHLYGAGECGGICSCMYQGGSNVAECFIFGQIAGANAAAAKDPLPAYEAVVQVESSPAHLGDETDLGATVDYAANAAEGELVGVGTGIGGDVPVTVTLTDDGTIASVTVGENAETAGIGSNAIEQLPEQFVGLSTAEEIDAVDGVSGATVTSNALKDAVKQALGL